ncbi:threonine-phosphate decarboxylase CobD [Cereibacter sphaeroides]|uniref:threonine-phosphate decarboxylase CobD n=1 Tax=Cereibacter sphaeroides TaxID=1063 RepID=UPI001EEE9761|nr:threonine-phosphate decarboxylase CobD [Cereibacter sphaeroides]MCE6960208.1 threonine-phosphate decarboxylase CobD [Cereibacter sphaeroides]MCE6974819.1 threonine-phosphate decarboxylase CobD [Cereibacter sphaeroides]
MRDHGGNLDAAAARFGGRVEDWLDLSTGINRRPYPMPALPLRALTALPDAAALAGLEAAARATYRTQAPMLAVAGAQAAIQLVPRLAPPGLARVLAPTYNEHAASLRAAGWRVEEVGHAEALAGADLAVVVNPNNPDGRQHSPETLRALLPLVGRLLVDESFGDPVPELSLAPEAGISGLLVLRSFGKFYGLAGLRLGFVLGAAEDIGALASMAGPWSVSGPAIAAGTAALADRAWAEATTARLAAETARLDGLAQRAGWTLEGGAHLFRLYSTPDAAQAQARLARARIWSRIFPWSDRLIRLGLPGEEPEWQRLEAALA